MIVPYILRKQNPRHAIFNCGQRFWEDVLEAKNDSCEVLRRNY